LKHTILIRSNNSIGGRPERGQGREGRQRGETESGRERRESGEGKGGEGEKRKERRK